MLRRDFLQTGALSALSVGAAKAPSAGTSCILLTLVGGPSHLDTFDMKPDAPREIRGPYRPIRTNVPGIEISEIFPRTARHADKFSIVRSMYHDGPAVHDSGHQLLQTGRAFCNDIEHPSAGCVTGMLQGDRAAVPAHILLPQPIGATGGNMPHGHGAGYLGSRHEPQSAEAVTAHANLISEPGSVRDRYGRNDFGQNCLLAARLVEAGVRFVTVNMFQTVFDEITWDSHGAKPFSPMTAYRDVVGPMFDMAYSSLLEDLHQRGLLASTMVVAIGEFGRSPRINPSGGRDHWTGCYSALLGGGPLKGGTLLGSSDAHGFEPKDRPTHPAEIVATIYKGLGIPLTTVLPAGNGASFPLLDHGVHPVHELFA
ncbi:MAG TPA: DUF1501 domain-containing protein [Bryobacteraceae bacterium]|nr:DUF1501 domain-containing protein [Bryobacteraceae bacterium]